MTWKIEHKHLIIKSEAYLNGDLLCIEIVPELTFYFQITLTFAYVMFVSILYFRNRSVAKAVGDRNDLYEFS